MFIGARPLGEGARCQGGALMPENDAGGLFDFTSALEITRGIENLQRDAQRLLALPTCERVIKLRLVVRLQRKQRA